ncbi:hypothetical protein ACF5W4_02085 [Bacillota bacterium Lsc_1132]
MKFVKLYLAGMVLGSWLSFPFLGKQTIKRFFPAALFISLFVFGESFVARKRVWWWFYKIGIAPLIAGPFFVGTMWILKFTYGTFFRYIAVNLLVHFLFVYVIVDWFKRIGYASIVRLKKGQLLILFIFKALILYVFQFCKEMSLSKAKQRFF